MSTESAPFNIAEFQGWLSTGERGMSSEAIVERLTGISVGGRSRGSYPYDPADFRRCEMLLRAVPIARLGLPLMADVSLVWARLVAEWDELVALAESEVPDAFTSRHHSGSAPLLSKRMQEIRLPVVDPGDTQ